MQEQLQGRPDAAVVIHNQNLCFAFCHCRVNLYANLINAFDISAFGGNFLLPLHPAPIMLVINPFLYKPAAPDR